MTLERAGQSGLVIVGAAGQTGRPVLQELRRRGVAVTVVIRDDRRRKELISWGASASVRGDLEDQPSMRRAFEGAQTVIVIPPTLHPREDELVANAAGAAVAAGVERFVLHSVLHPYTPNLPHHLRKANAEVAVRASPLRWVILQPAMYAQTVALYRSTADPSEFRIPWDITRRFSVVDVRDVAEAVAVVALDEGHDFAAYELAGPQALSMQSMIDQLGQVTSARLRAILIPPHDFVGPAAWSPSARADALAMFGEYDAHGLLGGAHTLRELLGREPNTFRAAMIRDSAPRLS